MAGDAIDVALDRPRSVHIVGVGGAGMSAIASVLAAMGHRVSGSDLKESAGLDRLRSAGVTVTVGHDAANVSPDHDFVAISTAIPPHNPERVAAEELGIPVLRRDAVLAAIAATKRTVSVAGTHGKTTTSSMLALALRDAGLAPSFIIGGELNEIGTGAAWTDGELFVVEADESDGTFLGLPTEVAVVTNVEPDHLEHYGDFDALVDAFDEFLARAERSVVCHDDPLARRLGRHHGAITYGTDAEATYRMVGTTSGRDGSRFELLHEGASLGEVTVPVPGAHNALNACAAAVTALQLGAPFDDVRVGLARFGGVARRFELRGTAAGVTFVDDYAHLPSEVAAALAAGRSGEWDRIVCVFQPHRYSRTASLAGEFADAFDEADVLVVTDIYSAGELPRPGVSGLLVAHAVLDEHPWRRLAYLPHHDAVASYLQHELRPGDLCLTLGAGDLTLLPDELIAALDR